MHCPKCRSLLVLDLGDGRHRCRACAKRFIPSWGDEHRRLDGGDVVFVIMMLGILFCGLAAAGWPEV